MTSRATPEDTLHPGSATTVSPHPRALALKQYHVFIASPGDVNDERNAVRAFFRSYNLNYAGPRELHFEVVDWENYSSAGVGRPQELITQQTLERYRESLALVVGIGQLQVSGSSNRLPTVLAVYTWKIIDVTVCRRTN